MVRVKPAAWFVIVAIAFPAALRAAPHPRPPVSQAQTADLPDAPGAQSARLRCLTCHRADIVRVQRLSRAGWEREVDKMIGWGAQVSATERDDIVDYLSGQFGLRARVPTDSDPGLTLLSRCLLCHDLRLIEQQALSAPGWAREVDKMRGWGAAVTESEAVILSNYLALRFGPER